MVRQKPPPGPVVGMADVITRQYALAAYRTASRHVNLLQTGPMDHDGGGVLAAVGAAVKAGPLASEDVTWTFSWPVATVLLGLKRAPPPLGAHE